MNSNLGSSLFAQQLVASRRHVVATISVLTWIALALRCSFVAHGGVATIPGSGGRTVEWTFTAVKTAPQRATVWLDIHNPDPSPIGFVICSMVNFPGAALGPGKRFTIDLVNNEWRNTAEREAMHNSYYFGCDRLEIPGGQKRYHVDNVEVDMGRSIGDEAQIWPYVDFLTDRPVHASVNTIRGRDNGVDPGPNAFGAFNVWAVRERTSGRAGWLLGNWYTMGTPGNYEARLVGSLSNAPLGTTVTFNLTGDPAGPAQTFRVTEDPFTVDIPFVVPPDQDAAGFLEMDPLGQSSEGTIIRFHGDVFSTQSSQLFQDGQFMHAIDIEFVEDTVGPRFETVSVQANIPGGLTVEVSGTDESTMLSAANLEYAVDGGGTQVFPIPFGDPETFPSDSSFEGRLTKLPLGSTISGQIVLFDAVGNTTVQPFREVVIIPEPSTVALSALALVLLLVWSSGYRPHSCENTP